ncbi:hypothetical protein A2841_01760 [Candidatus Kaiserbacteria bacterium RIFCSPHIGHO2_01_FULL_48_10]|uniref:Phosphatidic acid phosphatase type 2/haloperoxidase domain-containing protein n=1 Tax=Candidatus Kaiserbacteria bacterium RIFCSPHIGHO2_01_FULL_48_10 TaxID=1798476 RepID=A0A1F6C5E5_9BACT|nr:MAG: hypothetical protein A2841_01760 [Candidatus Kaiserbacteria bacterium RIFCSPHIGHO2_01_FULL_48_10]
MGDKPLLLALALLALSVYIPISRSMPRRICEMPIDGRVPFLPIFVLPYLGLLPFVIMAFFILYTTEVAVPFLLSLTIVGVLFGITGPLISCGAPRADATGKGILRSLVRFVYWVDGKHNNAVFPSTHVYLSVICGYYLALVFSVYAPFIWLGALLIAMSTIFIKQHNVMDIGGGVLWATTAIYLSDFVLTFLS